MFFKSNSISQALRLPSQCVLCEEYLVGSNDICSHCIKCIETIGPACRYCALPLSDNAFPVCGTCTKKPPYFDAAFGHYRYMEPLRTLLHQFKYHDGLYLTNTLAQLMMQAPPSNIKSSQCLIPVPMHPKRIRQRGFNQAAELAKRLSVYLDIPYDLFCCQKVKHTRPQAELDHHQRQTNLHNAFKTNKIPYKHITLIDDLLTTGNTANELARILKINGVQYVNVWCCARAA